jgi:hypothetical protein
MDKPTKNEVRSARLVMAASLGTIILGALALGYFLVYR